MNTLPAPRPDQDYIMADPVDQAQPQGSPIKIHKLLRAVRRFWWVPVFTLLLALGGAAALIKYMPATFVSRGRMWETVKLRLPEGGIFAEDVQTARETQNELLRSLALRDLALAHLRASRSNVVIPLDGAGVPVEVPIRVAQSSKSSVFSLQASGAEPRYVQAYLDALMTVYLQYKKNVREVVSGDTLSSLTEQVQRYERDLKVEQDALLAFQRSNNLVVLQQEGTIAGSYLATLKTKLSELQLEDRLLQLSIGSPLSTNASGTAEPPAAPGLPFGQGAGAADHLAAFKALEVLKMQRDRLARNLKPKHPKMVKLQMEIDHGEKMLAMYRDQNRAQILASHQSLQLKLENIQRSIDEWDLKVIQANSRLAEAERLKLNVERVKQVYDRLSALVQNVGISRNIDQETLQILEPASAPERTYAREIQVASLGGVGGLGLGLGIILLVALRDDRFGSVREITEKLGNGVLGQVPEVTFNGSGPLKLHDQDQEHMYSESYRNLRSALLYLAIEGAKPKIILVTSALPNEGKSTVAAGLARTLAAGGARVLLVDGDLRKGSLHGLLGLNTEPGFTELLRNGVVPDQALQSTSIPNLHFVASGHRISDAGDLFLAKRVDQILEAWRRDFDHVVIDSTPIFAADDAATLAPKVDGTVLVVRNHFSRAAQIREALELLLQRQARILGLVFNRADPKSRAYYYYKYKEYYAEKA